jgi:hypothetical protein
MDGALAITNDIDRIGLLTQALRQHLRGAWFVLDEQNPHRLTPSSARSHERAMTSVKADGLLAPGAPGRFLVGAALTSPTTNTVPPIQNDGDASRRYASLTIRPAGGFCGSFG